MEFCADGFHDYNCVHASTETWRRVLAVDSRKSLIGVNIFVAAAANFRCGKQRHIMCNKLVGRPMEILLVEDNLLQARLAIESLKTGQMAHRMTLIMDGEEALEFLRQRGMFAKAPRPDLILLDLRLPKIDGLKVLAEIRSDDGLKSIPVVVMTASKDDEDEQRCEMLDVEHYITKPVDLEKFLAVVKQLKRHWQADVILPAQS
jgi:two-component system, chemotaxis family, response regulator Rcp1